MINHDFLNILSECSWNLIRSSLVSELKPQCISSLFSTNHLNFLIFMIFLRTVNVFLMFNLYVKVIIFVVFIFCIYFIFRSFLIYIINFIFLLDFRFERALILRKKNVEIAIVDCLIVIFAQIFSSIMSFVFSIILFNFLIIFFNFVIWLLKYLIIVFVTFAQSYRVAYFIMSKNFIIIVYDIIFDRFFSCNL